MILPLFILFILISIIYLWLKMRKIKDRSYYLKQLPGPPPVLFFGNTLDAFNKGPEIILPKLIEYMDTYGDTVLVHDGAFSWAIVTRDYDFTELIMNSSTHIDKAQQYTYLESWLGQGLLTSTGNKWKTHRKVITPSFHFSILQEFIGIFDSVGQNLIARFEKEVSKDSVNIYPIISLYALDVICEAAMGVKINALEKETSEYVQNIKEMCSVLVERSFSPLHTVFYPFTWTYFKEKRALKVINRHVDGVINRKIEELKTKHRNSEKPKEDEEGVKKRLAFLDLLLNARINGEPLTREDLRDEVNTFMFEGHDTTSSAIAFCLYMLSTHPGIQEKVFKEQKEIFGDDLKCAKPTFSQLNEMKYLDLVIKETLRLFPSVPFFARKFVEDFEFKGNIYPKGMSILLFPFAFHRNPTYFPDPEKFIPERFESQNTRLPFSYTPFSAGPRNCIGQRFAMLEMLSTVSKVVRHFELLPSKPEHKLILASETILISKNGVCMSIKKRE